MRRFVFNQSLEWWQSQVEAGVKPTKRLLLDWFLTVLRPANPWIGDVTSRAARNAWDDLEIAFKRFFKNVKAGKQNGSKKNLYGYPQFKKKGLCDSFSVREKEKFDVDGRTIRIEKLSTRIKMRQTLRFTGLPKQVTIRYRAGKWFASILVEVIATPLEVIAYPTAKCWR